MFVVLGGWGSAALLCCCVTSLARIVDMCAAQVSAALKVGQSPDTADYDTRTGLMLACHAGHLSVAKLLLQGGADPNIRDFAGCERLSGAAGAWRSRHLEQWSFSHVLPC